MLNGERGLRAVKIGSLRFLVINFGGLVLDALFIYLIRCQSNMYVVIYDFRCTFEFKDQLNNEIHENWHSSNNADTRVVKDLYELVLIFI